MKIKFEEASLLLSPRYRLAIEEAKRKDINTIVKLQMELADFHKKIDKRYYKSGKERKERLEKRFLKILEKKRKNSKFLIAKIKNQTIGFMVAGIHRPPSYCREEKIGEVHQACITKKYRQKGVGKLLFEELLKWFRKRKIKFIEVSVDSRNKIGISAWRKYGFFEFQKKMRRDL